MSAPERIWAWEIRDNLGSSRGWNESCGVGRVEYIRADTVAEMIRQAVEQEREACAAAIRDSLPDEIEIYRMLLVSRGRKRIDYARTIAAAIRARGDASCG